MNKTIIYGGLLSLLSTTVYAEKMIMQPKLPVKLATSAPATATGTIVTPLEAAPVNTAATANTTPELPMNCNYKIPPQTTHVEAAIIKKWAEKAAIQSFDFSNTNIDQQLIELKACYTDQGWQSFSDALQKSGNLNTIKSQKLMVSSSVTGNILFSEIKENQWKVTLPMQVLYQNGKEKMTQMISVELIIGRKINGDLGIMQMIASPDVTSAPATSGSQEM